MFRPPLLHRWASTGLTWVWIAFGTRIHFVLPAVTSVAGGAMLIELRGVERLCFPNGSSVGPWRSVGRERHQVQADTPAQSTWGNIEAFILILIFSSFVKATFCSWLGRDAVITCTWFTVYRDVGGVSCRKLSGSWRFSSPQNVQGCCFYIACEQQRFPDVIMSMLHSCCISSMALPRLVCWYGFACPIKPVLWVHLRMGATHLWRLHIVPVCLTCTISHSWNLLQRFACSSIDCLPWVVNACPLFSNMGLVSSWGCLLRISCIFLHACILVRPANDACFSFLCLSLWGCMYNYSCVFPFVPYTYTD